MSEIKNRIPTLEEINLLFSYIKDNFMKNSEVINGMEYRGACNYSELPQSNNKNGDYWYCRDKAKIYAWNGLWKELGDFNSFTKVNYDSDKNALRVINIPKSIGTVGVDSTLSYSGYAADAKSSGIRIKALEDNFDIHQAIEFSEKVYESNGIGLIYGKLLDFPGCYGGEFSFEYNSFLKGETAYKVEYKRYTSDSQYDTFYSTYTCRYESQVSCNTNKGVAIFDVYTLGDISGVQSDDIPLIRLLVSQSNSDPDRECFLQICTKNRYTKIDLSIFISNQYSVAKIKNEALQNNEYIRMLEARIGALENA